MITARKVEKAIKVLQDLCGQYPICFKACPYYEPDSATGCHFRNETPLEWRTPKERRK